MTSSLIDSLADDGLGIASSSRLENETAGEAVVSRPMFCKVSSIFGVASSKEAGSWTRLTGRLLLTLSPMTCPKALTPLSVLPHFEYSQPSQLGSLGPSKALGVGKTSRALFNAFHSSSSTVGKGVSLLGWNSRPL